MWTSVGSCRVNTRDHNHAAFHVYKLYDILSELNGNIEVVILFLRMASLLTRGGRPQRKKLLCSSESSFLGFPKAEVAMKD